MDNYTVCVYKKHAHNKSVIIYKDFTKRIIDVVFYTVPINVLAFDCLLYENIGYQGFEPYNNELGEIFLELLNLDVK